MHYFLCFSNFGEQQSNQDPLRVSYIKAMAGIYSLVRLRDSQILDICP